MTDAWRHIHTYIDKFHLPGHGTRVQRYGFALLLVIFYFFLKTALIALFGEVHPFLFALFIVILSAWFGGFGPGILTAFLTGSIVYFFFLEPRFSLMGGPNSASLIAVSLFFIQAFVISLLSESHRKHDAEKTEFVGIISHELKSPLTSIKGYSELIGLLAKKKNDRKIAELAKKIDTQSIQLKEMINDMLDMTTIETGRLTYNDVSFSFTELVKEKIADQQVTTTSHKITLSGKSAKKIKGDRYRIGQVISNLLSNAIKYSPEAKKVTVLIKNYPRGVELRIKDSGPGIPVEEQKNIFKPFFRLKKTQSAKGTGIGLFISKQIVERHHGNIWVESSQGKGAIFCVQLPTNSK